MEGKRWAVYYVIWAVALSLMVGCDQSSEDFFDDMSELLKELLRIFLQWLLGD